MMIRRCARNADLWRHPAMAGSYGPALRDRLLDAAAHVEEVAAEFASLPTAASHGDVQEFFTRYYIFFNPSEIDLCHVCSF